MTHAQTLFLQELYNFGGVSFAFWVYASRYAGIITDEAIENTHGRILSTEQSNYGNQITQKYLSEFPKSLN